MSDVGVVLSAQYLFSSAESSLVEFTNRNLGSSPDAAQAASDMNDVMDEMLNRSDDSGSLRRHDGGALFDAAEETSTIVAAAKSAKSLAK